MFLTFRYRVKDASASTRRALRAQARSVNFVWNYCCEIDRESDARYRAGMAVKRPSAFDLATLCRGVTKDLGIHSDTIDAVCRKFAAARNACFPKTPRFRSFKRSLDFIPFSNFDKPAKLVGGNLTVLGRTYRLWMSRPIPDGGKLKTWEFSTDSRGRWYVNIQVEMPAPNKREIKSKVGIDLGLKTLATLSDGSKIAMPAFYRMAEARLSQFKSRGQKARARVLSAKVANQRKHFLHVATTDLVRRHDRIVVGDASASRLGKTRMAKSIHDAAWAMLRSMLQYKAIAHGATVEIVSERHGSATCSACRARSGPKGIAGLRVREWKCEDCGAVHDRDVNASINILGSEHRPPVAETPRQKPREDVNSSSTRSAATVLLLLSGAA